MPYKYAVVNEGQYISLIHEGQLEDHEAEISREELTRMLRAFDWHRVLIDAKRVTSQLDDSELHEFTDGMHGLFPEDAAVALVLDESMSDKGDLMEQLAQGQGVKLKWFKGNRLALEWLGQN